MNKHGLYSDFLQHHQLPAAYLVQAEQWFAPLISDVLSQIIATPKTQTSKALVIGINGCQGSGKSTLADYLRTTLVLMHNIETVSVSLDDFYLTKAERQALAESEHPLLSPRGVPGTHDAALAIELICKLARQKEGSIALPTFDKSRDDRDEDQPHIINLPVKVIILEGWCLGAEPQTHEQLATPLNDLETEQDQNGQWRAAVNQALASDYAALFGLVDCWLMLKAPAFNCVYQWRLEQEQKMAAKLGVDILNKHQSEHSDIMDAEEIQHFISHYQRITEHGLKTLPNKMHHLYELDQHRNIVRHSQPVAMP